MPGKIQNLSFGKELLKYSVITALGQDIPAAGDTDDPGLAVLFSDE